MQNLIRFEDLVTYLVDPEPNDLINIEEAREFDKPAISLFFSVSSRTGKTK